MELSVTKRQILTRAALLLMAVLFCTYLRVSLLLLYPLITVLAFYAFQWKLNQSAVWILGMTFLFWLFSLRNGLYLTYNLVSFYYFIPLVLLLMASPKIPLSASDNFRVLMLMLTVVGIVNDIVGLAQYAHLPGDDNFVGIYGRFTVSQNGLSILNGILFFYHLCLYLRDKNKFRLLLMSFFLLCCVLGFYGAGLLVLMTAIVGTFLKLRPKNILITLLLAGLTVLVAIILMKAISPLTYDYDVAIIRRFLNPDLRHAARKEIAFINYFQSYPHHLPDLVFGSGPGTFNSRTAFMVGSPTYFNIDWIKSPNQPYYFREYAYTLWNSTNTGPYDGFMNQPFSSLLALAGEYGLIITLCLALFVGRQYRNMSRLIARHGQTVNMRVEGNMYKFCSLYAMLFLVIDNFMEYPEVIGLLLIIIKLSQQRIRKMIAVTKD